MPNLRSYLRRHHVALVALLLVVTGGTAYAASVIPKNAVGSKQVKNNSLKGKDLKDGEVTGADLADGSIGGADLANGSVGGADLGAGSVGGGTVADGSLTTADLAAGTVPEVLTRTEVGAWDTGTGWLDYATFPGVGSVQFICSGATGAGVRFMAVGGGTMVWAYVEGQDLTTGQGASGITQSGGAFIRQANVSSALIAGRIVAHSATRSLDVDVRVSTANNLCTITGTGTLTPNPAGLPG